MPASPESEEASSLSHSTIILLCDFGQGLAFRGPLFFLTEDRWKAQGNWEPSCQGGRAPSPEASRPVGICGPEGDFLGPAQFPALLTSPLDGCPEQHSGGKGRRALSQPTPQPSLWGPGVSPTPEMRWGSVGSLLVKEEGTAPWLKLLICCVTSGKSLPLSGPWTPVFEMRRAKISKLCGNS